MRFFLAFFLILKTLFASSNILDISVGSYKSINFDTTISEVRVSDSSKVLVEFESTKKNGLKTLKIFGKSIGYATLFIILNDNTTKEINLNIVKNLGKLEYLLHTINRDIKVSQNSNKIILEGKIKSYKEKIQILDILKKSDIDLEKDFINLLKIQNPAQMIRVKLYVVEVNNEEGNVVKNSWAVGYRNYIRSDYSSYTAQESFIPTISNSMESALTLTGGLTAAANYLGSEFSTGIVLNYLKTKGVANVLDETTLLTLENKDAKFHAGGTIYLKTSTTSAEGLPTTEIRELEYGLLLKIKSKEIINKKYIDLEIETESTKLNFEQVVDGIPGFSKKSVLTNVVIKDGTTIVLGGLVNSTDAKSFEKIPLLGDIALLGKLFRSENFINDKSELVFFITPEIVDVSRD